MCKSFLLFIFLGMSLSVLAQEQMNEEPSSKKKDIIYDKNQLEGTALNEETLKNFKNDPDFDYREIEPEDNWLTRFQNKIKELWNSFLNWLLGGKEASSTASLILTIVFYLFIAGLLALLIWVFLKIDNARAIIAPNHKGVFMGDDEEIINNQDIQSLIDQALKDKNYRLAVRFYYLLTLQQLSGKELIDWQVQKTNHEYIYEIKSNELRSQFGRLTDIYDYIWYGNFEVDEGAFAKAQLAFHKISNEI